MARITRVALVYGVPVGDGGLAVQTANAMAAVASAPVETHAIGPGLQRWPRSDRQPAVTWHTLPPANPGWASWRPLRAYRGLAQHAHDRRIGCAAAARLDTIRPDLVYGFTLAGLESLRWARAHGVPAILESPNGHIRSFRRIYVDEHRTWCRGTYRGHPTEAMVRRVEEEYRLADRIRVSSAWAKRSLVEGGVPADKIHILQQPVDLERYRPAPRAAAAGPFRIVSVGTLDLRKGFVYLLDAARRLGDAVTLELLGGTVDRCTRRLFDVHAAGLPVEVYAGDPRPALARADVSVLATLEDGSPFAVAEAMASGVPVIVTDACGAAEWVEPGRSGWIVAARNVDALAAALEDARSRRAALPGIGLAARQDTERRASAPACDRAVADWVLRAAADTIGAEPTPVDDRDQQS